MNDSCRVTVKPLAVRLAYLTALASLAVSSSVYAISFGHSRLLSPVGQPLQIQVPVHALTDQERNSLVVSVAAAPAWEQAGLTPPVDPATMQVAVVDGVRAGSKLITVRSSQPLSSNVADLLLAVRSSSGQMQHQVSLLAPADLEVARASGGVTASGSGAVGTPGNAAATSIQIRRGDTLFALARRHAVPGISVYQWMIGVMQANPQAFINDNVNLIKAGATLNVPGGQQLAALSDREAREIFQKHATAFAEYRPLRRQLIAARSPHPKLALRPLRPPNNKTVLCCSQRKHPRRRQILPQLIRHRWRTQGDRTAAGVQLRKQTAARLAQVQHR